MLIMDSEKFQSFNNLILSSYFHLEGAKGCYNFFKKGQSDNECDHLKFFTFHTHDLCLEFLHTFRYLHSNVEINLNLMKEKLEIVFDQNSALEESVTFLKRYGNFLNR